MLLQSERQEGFNITVAHLLSHEGGWSQRYGDQMFMPTIVADQMKTSLPVDTKTIVRFASEQAASFYSRHRTFIL